MIQKHLKRWRSVVREHPIIFAICSTAVVSSLILLAWVAYQHRFLINPDGVSYISIATYYAHTEWSYAINAYWSPLLSWLMAPFIALGVNGQTAFIAVNYLTAVFILLFGSFLTYIATKSKFASGLYFIAIMPFLVYIMKGPITPDALVVAWILVFIYTLWKIDEFLKTHQRISWKKYITMALVIGTVGALGYVTKLYLQPVFIVSIIIVLILRLFLDRGEDGFKDTSRYLIFCTMVFVVYGLVSLLWIAPMSVKYDRFIVGSSYEFNSTPGGLPTSRMPIPTPNDKAVTNWEDPTYLTKYKLINPPKHTLNKMNKLKALYYKAPVYLSVINKMWIFIFGTFLVAGAVLVLHKRLTVVDRRLSVLVVISGVYTTGYGIRSYGTEPRYLWPVLLIGIILACVFMGILWSLQYSQKSRAKYAATILLALLIPLSLYFKYTPHPKEYLKVGEPTAIQTLAVDMKKKNIIQDGTKIAGSSFGKSTYVGYYTGAKSYGTIKHTDDTSDDQATVKQLRDYGIEYYIDYSGTGYISEDHLGSVVYRASQSDVCKNQDKDPVCQLKVYRIK